MYLCDPNQIGEDDFITSTYNLDKGIIVLIIWIVIFYGISRIIFTRKDIVNE
jgi:ABC-type transport system involved in multi-copper enzyme maturation permease subunit